MNREQIAALVAVIPPEIYRPYTDGEITEVLDLFFRKFRFFTGREHPEPRRDQFKFFSCMLPYYSNTTKDPQLMTGEACEILPDQYSRIMNEYFNTRYPHCNYHIHHFLAGKIRRNAAERAGIVHHGENPVYVRQGETLVQQRK